MTRRTGRGFTLVELLVVITIVVLLLALLAPALDEAIYQAELTLCGSRLHGLAIGVQVYAMDFKRRYPYRPGVDKAGFGWRDNSVKVAPPFGDFDDRFTLRGYIALNGHLVCPLNKAIDIESSVGNIYSNYQLWFGFRFYSPASTPREGMLRLGDRLTWDVRRFDILASDEDEIWEDQNQLFGAHPDRDGMTWQLWRQDALYGQDGQNSSDLTTGLAGGSRFTLSRWQFTGSPVRRGPIDRSFAMGDGAVTRLTDISLDEIRREERGLVKVPTFSKANSWPPLYTTLPAE